MKYVVVAALLVFAAMAVPNLHTAMQRSKEKRTMAAIRDIATEWEARAEKSNKYMLEDVRNVSQTDGWGNRLEFAAAGNEYSIRAYGSDHRRDDTILEGAHTDFGRDIIYANGTFIAYPEGL